jgi:pantothenate kinase
MQTENITLIIAIAGAVGAICATLVGGLLTLWGQWLTRKSEERRHFMDLCFKAATENLIRDIETAKARSVKEGPVSVAPIDL